MKTTRLLATVVIAAVGVCASAFAQTYPPPMNLTRYMTATASSNNDSAGSAPKYAVDGLVCEESRWISDPVNGPHWLQVDLSGTFQIGSANVITGSWDTSPVANFSLQYWTGSAWANIPGATVTNNTKTQLQILFTSPVTTSQVRFYSTDNGSIAVKELAVFPPKSDGTAYPIDTGIDIRSGMLPMITADSYNASGQRPYLAYDGFVDDSSRWISASGTSQHWLEYDFVTQREVAYAHIYNGLGTGSVIANFRLQSWDATNSVWVDIPGGSVTGNTSTAVALTFTSTIRTLKVRLVSDDDTNIRVKEMVFLPPNGGAGYPLGTGVVIGAPPSQKWSDFSDNYYNINNEAANLNLMDAPNGKVTVETDSSSFAQQYNILLNIGTDTYRICNRANKQCLEVVGGSLAAGAVVQENHYVSRPYQQWRLNKLSNGYYEIINAYSGLLLTVNGSGSVPGSGVVQQARNSTSVQYWSLPFVNHFPKKGTNGANISGDYVVKYNCSHYYNWKLDPTSGKTSDDFQSMWWNDSASRTQQLVLIRPDWAAVDEPKYLIGFNEPNHSDQANMTEQNAINEWSRMEQVKLPLVGPQPDSPGSTWGSGSYGDFFNQADAMGVRLEEGGGHIYPTASTPDFDTFSTMVTSYYNLENSRVQWVTEFDWVNWGGAATWTADQLYSILAETLWRYENNAYVKRYQWFAFSSGWVNGAPGAFENNGMLPLGRLYAAWDGDLNYHTNTWYIIHNRGTHAQLQNSSGAPVNTTISTVDSTINWYLAPASSGKYYIVSNDGKRLSSNGTTVTLAAAGTTGTAVEWVLTPVATSPAHYGWYYLDHPASSKRLDSTGTSGSLIMSTDTDNSPRWRFIKPYLPASTTFTWTNAGGGIWSTGTNWNGGSAPVDGSTTDFSTLDITADRTVTLDSSRSIGALNFGDTSGTQNWTLASSGGSILTLDTGNGGVPAITVNQNNATISAKIDSTSGFTKSGSGTLTLSGANTFTGGTQVTGGAIAITQNTALGIASPISFTVNTGGVGKLQVSNNITVANAININGSSSGSTTSGVIESTGNNTLNGNITWNTTGGANTSIVSLSGVLTLGGNITTASPVTGSRTVNLGGAGDINVSGVITNGTATLALAKGGAGTLTLAGQNSYTGTTTVNAGTLLVNGTASATATTVASGATFGGTGAAGSVTVQSGGSLAPAGTAVGTFTVGNATLSGTLAIGIANANSADQLQATGSVTLGGPLAITALAGLPAGTTFTILNKTSAGAVSGTFSGLPQNSFFTASSNTWIISYTGGDGNDVTLSIPTAQQTWQQAKFGASWNNPAVAGDNADPDGDGVSNLLEYAFGGNPNAADQSILPAIDNTGSFFSIIYRKAKAATDLVFTVQESPDLSPNSWKTAVPDPANPPEVRSDDGTVQVIRFTSPQGTTGKKFLRVQVTKP